MLPLSTFNVPWLIKFEVTRLMMPVFSNRPLLMNTEGDVLAMFVFATKSYVPLLITKAPLSMAPAQSVRPDSNAPPLPPLKSSTSAPEIVPEKFAASRVKVTSAPLLVTVPPPKRSEIEVVKPATSTVAPGSTVVCATPRSPKFASAALSVPATTLKL